MVPLGYFLINSFCGSERANLLSKCLELFSNTGAKCNSITFDGAPSNIAMCTSLGANFNNYPDNFQPWFYNPSKPQEKIFVFWDAAHMLKLVRNTLGDKKKLIDGNGHKICWEHIVNLQNIQESKGVYAANKFKISQIKFRENIMNVRLAAQKLSKSVSDGLLFCENLNLLTGVKGTATFCSLFNDAFDLLNCRNK